MRYERQIEANWPAAHFADKFAQGRQTWRGDPAAWWPRRSFDPVEGAGYEAAAASA